VWPLKHYTKPGVRLRCQLLEHCVMLSEADQVNHFETRDMETSKDGLLYCCYFRLFRTSFKKQNFTCVKAPRLNICLGRHILPLPGIVSEMGYTSNVYEDHILNQRFTTDEVNI